MRKHWKAICESVSGRLPATIIAQTCNNLGNTYTCALFIGTRFIARRKKVSWVCLYPSHRVRLLYLKAAGRMKILAGSIDRVPGGRATRVFIFFYNEYRGRDFLMYTLKSICI